MAGGSESKPRDGTQEGLRKAPEGHVDGLSPEEHVVAAMAGIKAHAKGGVLSRKEERLTLHLQNVQRMIQQRG